MKSPALLIINVVMVCMALSCRCDLVCPDCQTLDRKNCECLVDLDCQCSDSIQNGNETGIDCGGDCFPCFECLSEYCTMLCGSTSDQEKKSFKTWILQSNNDNAMKFYSTSNCFIIWEGGSGNGFWAFDDPGAPDEIIITLDNYPPNWDNPLILKNISLTADTLIYTGVFGTSQLMIFEP